MPCPQFLLHPQIELTDEATLIGKRSLANFRAYLFIELLDLKLLNIKFLSV